MKLFVQLWKKSGFLLLLFIIIAGFYNKSIAILAVICMLGPIVLASLGHGRLWCKNICPRGNLYDNVICKFGEKKTNPRCIKSIIFRIVIIVFVFTMFGIGIRKHWGDLEAMGGVFHRMIIGTTVIGIVLSFFFNHRTWCCLCPIGSIACFISKTKRRKR
ncbi:4Fe-4S binding protein [Wukongibacter baidiensis]|uniref:4Fe-4S binding protein n=1 Tax=Wukongibacter baidiensis TaxID=1723361 RepID=UPI003D7F4D2F